MSSRTAVIMPDETTINSMSVLSLFDLAEQAEIPRALDCLYTDGKTSTILNTQFRSLKARFTNADVGLQLICTGFLTGTATIFSVSTATQVVITGATVNATTPLGTNGGFNATFIIKGRKSYPEETMRRLLRTVRATFDGRQYNIKRKELIELHDAIYGPMSLINVTSATISYENALYYWPTITAPTASFTKVVGTGPDTKKVTFTDTSTGTISRWLWDFGEPSSATNVSYDKNPVHRYATAGTFTARLTVTNPLGGSSTTTVSVTTT